MDRFKEDLEKVKELEKNITDNLKERAKLAKAGQPTTKVLD
jgi:DNA anti-recombination protein RmuC